MSQSSRVAFFKLLGHQWGGSGLLTSFPSPLLGGLCRQETGISPELLFSVPLVKLLEASEQEKYIYPARALCLCLFQKLSCV